MPANPRGAACQATGFQAKGHIHQTMYALWARAGRPAPARRLAANSISTIYSAYLSAAAAGAEVPVKAF